MSCAGVNFVNHHAGEADFALYITAMAHNLLMSVSAMKTWILLLATGMLMACSKREAPAPSSAAQPVVPANVPAEDANAPKAPTAPVTTVDESGNIPGVEIINSAIGDFVAANGRVPKDLNELVLTKYLQAVPPAPVGKKYAIDPVRRQVRLDKL